MNNILFIHYGENGIRGSEVVLLNLLKTLNKEVFYPIVICSSPQMYEELLKIGIQTYQLEFPEIMVDGPYVRFEIIKYFKTVYKMFKLIKDKRISLIYCNSGLPVQTGFIVSRLINVPTICHLHSPFHRRYYYLWLICFVDKLIFCSNSARGKSLLKVNYLGNVKTIYNGVDTERYRPLSQKDSALRKELGIEDHNIVIGQVGSLVYGKGVDVLLNAFKIVKEHHSNTKLVLVGEGKEKRVFEDLALKLNIKNEVIFTGQMKNTERILQNVFDINVLASRREALGLALIEGASCGLPNVCSNCDGMPEVVQDGITGYHFDVGNAGMLAEKLLLLINDPHLRQKMGKNGRARTKERFSLSKYVQEVEKEIRQLIS